MAAIFKSLFTKVKDHSQVDLTLLIRFSQSLELSALSNLVRLRLQT